MPCIQRPEGLRSLQSPRFPTHAAMKLRHEWAPFSVQRLKAPPAAFWTHMQRFGCALKKSNCRSFDSLWSLRMTKLKREKQGGPG